MMYSNNHMTSGGWIVAILVTVMILVLLVVAIAWVTRGLRDRRSSGATVPASPLEILDRRLASGEIKTEQYEQLRRALAAQPATP